MRPGLLAWLGGARPALLRDSPSDVTWYGAMGAVLAGTAAMAAASAMFALYTAVGTPLVPAIIVGILWGGLILSLDRMLVISMSATQGFWRTAAYAVPRLLLALLIGSVISVPLVLQIFEREIAKELQVMHSENLIANQKKLEEQFADIPTTQSRVEQLQRTASGESTPEVSNDRDVAAAQAEVNAAQTAYDKAAAAAQCELDGSCGTGSRGDGPVYQAAKAEADRARARLDRANTALQRATAAAQAKIGGSAAAAKKAAEDELRTLVPALESRKAAKEKEQRELDQSEEDNEGILARLEALERLSDGHPTLWTAHLALMALFACIELLPVITKLLSGRRESTYDRVVREHEDHALEKERKRLLRTSDLDEEKHRHEDEIRKKRADARRKLEDDRLARQVEGGVEANKLLAEKQKEITAKAIDTWGQVAALRTDDELARWLQRHSYGQAPPPPSGGLHVPTQPFGSVAHNQVNGQQVGQPVTPPPPVAGQ